MNERKRSSAAFSADGGDSGNSLLSPRSDRSNIPIPYPRVGKRMMKYGHRHHGQQQRGAMMIPEDELDLDDGLYEPGRVGSRGNSLRLLLPIVPRHWLLTKKNFQESNTFLYSPAPCPVAVKFTTV